MRVCRLFIMVGDVLEQWTNGLLQATEVYTNTHLSGYLVDYSNSQNPLPVIYPDTSTAL